MKDECSIDRSRKQENIIIQNNNLLPVLYSQVEKKIVSIRGLPVIVDADVAALYGVETKRVNEAIKNNPDKFPEDYMFELTAEELQDLRSKISTANISSKSRTLPKAFTEKGLYMLATILKSKRATKVTFAIIETFAKVRNLKRELVICTRNQTNRCKTIKCNLSAKFCQILSCPIWKHRKLNPLWN